MIMIKFSDSDIIKCDNLKEAQEVIQVAFTEGALPIYIEDEENNVQYGCEWEVTLVKL